MKLRYEMAVDDYVELARFRHGQHWYGVMFLLAPVVGGTLLVFGVLGVALVHRSQWAVIALVAIPFLLLPKWFLRRDYFRRDNQSPEIELKIDEDGIRTENISHLGSEKQFNWNDFSHYRESSKHYLLYPAKGVLVIPKRIFDPDEIASFDGLLRRKLFSYLPRM